MRKSKYPKYPKTFGEKIRKRRLDLKWTLFGAAKMINISESYLARIETNKQLPSDKVAKSLCILFNCRDIKKYVCSKCGGVMLGDIL